MVNNLKLIFVHGVSAQTTNYSDKLYSLIVKSCRRQLREKGRSEAAIQQTLRRMIHHEVLWADTTDLDDRYVQLLEPRPNLFWWAGIKRLDPIMLQIMQYIKDKGDKRSGRMNILKHFNSDIESILTRGDIGEPERDGAPHAIVVAHSLGAVLSFDYLMRFRQEYRLREDAVIHSFITMGSPLPLYTAAMGHPDSELALPSNVRSWVDIRSRFDVVARPAQAFFRHIPISEHLVFTALQPIKAHVRYWKSRQVAEIIAKEVIKALEA
jgi:pimeloyl-ACP methyl ester carboxylesterase